MLLCHEQLAVDSLQRSRLDLYQQICQYGWKVNLPCRCPQRWEGAPNELATYISVDTPFERLGSLKVGAIAGPVAAVNRAFESPMSHVNEPNWGLKPEYSQLQDILSTNRQPNIVAVSGGWNIFFFAQTRIMAGEFLSTHYGSVYNRFWLPKGVVVPDPPPLPCMQAVPEVANAKWANVFRLFPCMPAVDKLTFY